MVAFGSILSRHRGRGQRRAGGIRGIKTKKESLALKAKTTLRFWGFSITPLHPHRTLCSRCSCPLLATRRLSEAQTNGIHVQTAGSRASSHLCTALQTWGKGELSWGHTGSRCYYAVNVRVSGKKIEMLVCNLK